MDGIDTGLFLLLIILGVYVQTITGFAMGLLIVGGATVLNVAPIAFTAAVVSLLSLLNAVLVLRHSHKHISWPIVGAIGIPMLPFIAVGIYLLSHLSSSETALLRRILGLAIVIAGTLLIVKPQPWQHLSGRLAAAVTGIAGGLIGGMFSTGGAPIAFFMYRQPLLLATVRATLLAIFTLTNLARTTLVGASGQIDGDIILVSAIAVPLVLLVTALARHWSPASADTAIRKFVFVLLILIGLSLLFS